MNPEQLKHLALIVRYCRGSHDLAAGCTHVLAERGAIAADGFARYPAIV